MNVIKCKRLYKGNIDIRSYIVMKAIAKNYSLHVVVEGEKDLKEFTPEQLKSPVSVSKEFESKFNDSVYKLYSYKWK